MIQFKDRGNKDSSVYPISIQKAIVDKPDGDDLTTYITEYNISLHQVNKTAGVDSPRRDTSIFTLSEAIAQVPEEYKHGGLKLTFNSDMLGVNCVRNYVLDSSVWTGNVKSWYEEGSNAMVGYYTCTTSGGTAAKTVNDASGYVLSLGGSMKIRFTNKHTGNSTPTLNINGQGAKSIIYDGSICSSTNTWEDGETVECYYDGQYYQANNVSGGGTFATGQKVKNVGIDNEPTVGSNNLVKSGGIQNELALGAVYDVSAHNGGAVFESLSALLSNANLNTLIPTAVRKGGMSIKFIQGSVPSSDNKYVQYRLMSDTFSTTESDWQGVDNEPTAGSKNLVGSGGAKESELKDMSLIIGETIDINIIGSITLSNGLLGSNGLPNNTDNPNYKYSVDYIPVKEGQKFKTNARSTGTGRGICYYNSSKTLLSAIDGASDIYRFEEFTVPSGASYMRICYEKANLYALQLLMIGGSVDDMPTEYSKGLTRSGGVYKAIKNMEEKENHEISKVKESNLNLVFDGNGFINGNASGAISSENGFNYTTDYTRVFKGDVLLVSVWASGNVVVALYDDSKVYDQGYNFELVDGSYGELTIPHNGYLRFSNRNQYNTSPNAKWKSTSLEDLENQVAEAVDQSIIVHELLDNTEIVFDVTELEQGLLRSTTGKPFAKDGTNYRYTPNFFAVKSGLKVKTNMQTSGTGASVCFYASDKDTLIGIGQGDISNGIIVPNDAKYARFSTERYSELEGKLYAYQEKKFKNSTDKNIEGLFDVTSTKDEVAMKFYSIDKDAWIANDTPLTYYPGQKRITHNYQGSVTPERRFVALGFDDYVPSDFSVVIPLLQKYGFRAEFNKVHRAVDISDNEADVKAKNCEVNAVMNSGSELGDHTWIHQKFPYDEPMFNGQNPSSPDGNQVPFPSNDQLRNDRGDGKNVFGITLTDIVKDTIGYQAPDINVAWGSMTDAQCQQFREYFSLYGGANDLIVLFDTLSNKYLGTTGSSRGSWNGSIYTGGIFTGCATSANHEVWERILEITNMLLKERFRINYNYLTWSLPGSKASHCWFEQDGKYYFDAEHTKLMNCLAKFESSLYSGKIRSWTDVLKEYGYKTTHDSASPGRYDGQKEPCMSLQFILNSHLSRPDALPYHTNRSFSFSRAWTEYTEGIDLQGSEPYEVQMYDGGANDNTKDSFRNAIEAWRHNTANGVVWGEVIDSDDTWSFRLILEGLLKYAYKTGIELFTKAEAYDVCFKHPMYDGNLIYNPRLRNTAKEFMPTALTVPSNPDGYIGDCSVSMVDGVPVLITTGSVVYQHYGIPYGTIKYSVDAKGSGTITIRSIKNKTPLTQKQYGDVLCTINVSGTDYVNQSAEFIVSDNGLTAYEGLCAGYGEKIVGLYIEYSSGLTMKNFSIVKE